MERENHISTKLAIHIYTDKKCSQPYDDGQTTEERTTNGYIISDGYFKTGVTFRPPFYSCESCSPQSLDGFSKQDNTWFDDDALATKRYFDDWIDDYVANDDAYAVVQEYANNEQVYSKDDDDNFYTADDDDGSNRRQLSIRELIPLNNDLEVSIFSLPNMSCSTFFSQLNSAYIFIWLDQKFDKQFRNRQRKLSSAYSGNDDSVLD